MKLYRDRGFAASRPEGPAVRSAAGTSSDVNANGIPDECECVGDLDGDGEVGQGDLGILPADWGCTDGDCPGDIDADGDTDQSDLGILLSNWGCAI